MLIEELHSTNNNAQPKHTSHQETGAVLDSKTETQHVKRRQKVEHLSEVDYVPTNTHSSQNEFQLYNFEDNEAVIKMIIKRQSPTMRHVSRTHRVALDCCLTESTCTQNPHQICWYQEPICGHVNSRKTSDRRTFVCRDQLSNLDHVTTNAHSSQCKGQQYISEDNEAEAVIKMIIKGRSPMMRHVSRTHRVALDWLFDRINLEPKIQIKYMYTKNQLADILTKGSFSKNEWNHLLCVFNIMSFSMYYCSHFKKISVRFQSTL